MMFIEYFNVSSELLHEQFVYGTYLDEVWVRERKVPNGQGGYNSEYLFFHHDPLYSVCGITDTAGNLLEAYEYDPYGKRIVIIDGPDPDSIVNFTTDDIRDAASPRYIKSAFTGQRFDLESGLYYYKERYYHPTWGRFINRDLIGYKDGLNLFQYVCSNPVDFRDPYGLWKIKRKAGEYYAVARATKHFDKSVDLAKKIGLSGNEYQNWMTDMGYGIKPFYCMNEKVLIPNTIYAAYNGHWGIPGRFLSQYTTVVAKFKLKGYHVINHNNRPSSYMMEAMLSTGWNNKYLQGFFFLGHGSPDYDIYFNVIFGSTRIYGSGTLFYPFQETNDPPNDYLLDQHVLSIKKYGLSIVKIWACYSANGKWQGLASQNPHDVDLKDKIYIPIIHL